MLKNLENKTISALLFLPFVFSLSIEHWLSGWFLLLLLISLVRVWSFSFDWLKEDKNTRILLWLGLAMFVSTLVSNTISGWTDANIVRFEVDFKQFLALILLVYLFNFKQYYYWFFRVLPIAGIILPVAICIYQNCNMYAHGNMKVYGPIIMSDFSALLFFLILFSKNYTKWNSELLKNTLFYLGLVASFTSMIFSMSRNGWVVFLVLTFITLIFYFKEFKKHFFKWIILFFIVFGIIYLSPVAKLLKKRILSAKADIVYYYTGKKTQDFQGSQNFRLKQWEGALKVFSSKPLFGFGAGGTTVAMNKSITDGLIKEATVDSQRIYKKNPNNFATHVHNQYLTTLLDKGLIGMFLQLGFLLFILWVFFKHRHQDKKIAMLGMILVVAYLVFGLTEVPFIRNNHTAIFYLGFIVLWHSMRKN